MKLKLFMAIVLFINLTSLAQGKSPTDAINGAYYLMEAERGVDTKLFEFGEHNGTKLLAIAACKKCIPAVYTYQEEDSKEVGRNIFYNSTGLYVFEYDSESFVMIMLKPSSDTEWTDFYFSNFYSKNKSKVVGMSKQKIKNFIDMLSK